MFYLSSQLCGLTIHLSKIINAKDTICMTLCPCYHMNNSFTSTRKSDVDIQCLRVRSAHDDNSYVDVQRIYNYATT